MKLAAQFILTFVLNAAWQGALIIGFAAVCDGLLRGVAARSRHGLWVCALCLSFVLPMLSSARLIADQFQSTRPVAEISRSPVVTTVLWIDGEPAEPVKAPAEVKTQKSASSWSVPRLKLSVKLASILAGLYLLFLVYRFASLFRAWRRTRVIIGSAYDYAFPPAARTAVDRCRDLLRVRRVRILCSALVPVPITVGFVRPLVILPERLLLEADPEVFASALGHELGHVARRDYLTNLIYEFIFLPLSFHPAVALMRRRIRETRELCCDELVATKLLKPDVYARSLVRLIGSVPIARRLAENTTIGIAESDNLEVRIMSLLKKSGFSPLRKALLLTAASLLLAISAVVGAAFALPLEINRQEPDQAATRQKREETERSEQKQAIDEIRNQQRVLQEQLKVASESQKPEIEKGIRELQRSLTEYEKLLAEYQQQKQMRPDVEARLREVQENLAAHNRALLDYKQKQEADEKQLREARERVEQLLKNNPGDEARMKEAREKLAELEANLSNQQSRVDRKVKVIHRVDPEYSADARAKNIEGVVLLTLTIDREGVPQNVQIKQSLYPSLDQKAIEAVRQWRFEPALKDGKPVSITITAEIHFALDYDKQKREEQEQEEVLKNKMKEKERAGRGEGKGEGQGEGSGPETVMVRKRKENVERDREERARRGAELTAGASISMDRAIQIALSKYPGKVLACSLGRDREGDNIVFYHVVIVSGEPGQSTTMYVWVSAVDGTIIKSEKE